MKYFNSLNGPAILPLPRSEPTMPPSTTRTTAAPKPADRPQADAFEPQVLSALAGVRDALANLLRRSGATLATAADVERFFSVDAKLGWQVYRVATAASPLDAGVHVPGPSGRQRLLRSAARQGIDQQAIDEANAAFSALDEVVKRHAGGRAVYESMIAGLSADIGDSIDLARRREAYEGNRHIYGVSARTQFACVLHHPNPESGNYDLALIRGYVDLVRLRESAALTLTQYQGREVLGARPEESSREAIDPDGERRFGGPVLAEFSTDPGARLLTEQIGPGHFITRIDGQGIGARSAGTYVLAEVIRRGPVRGSGDLPLWNPATVVRMPAEVLFLDHLFDRAGHERMTGGTALWGAPGGDVVLTDHIRDYRRLATPLPCGASTAYIGAGRVSLPTHDVPHYRDIVAHVCDVLGWDLDGFDIYRTRVRYPVLGALVISEYRAPTG